MKNANESAFLTIMAIYLCSDNGYGGTLARSFVSNSLLLQLTNYRSRITINKKEPYCAYFSCRQMSLDLMFMTLILLLSDIYLKIVS